MIAYLKIAFALPNFLASICLILAVTYWMGIAIGTFNFSKVEAVFIQGKFKNFLENNTKGFLAKLLHYPSVPFTMFLAITIIVHWLLQLYINMPNSPINPTMDISLAIIWLIPSILCSIILAYLLLLPLKAQFSTRKD